MTYVSRYFVRSDKNLEDMNIEIQSNNAPMSSQQEIFFLPHSNINRLHITN